MSCFYHCFNCNHFTRLNYSHFKCYYTWAPPTKYFLWLLFLLNPLLCLLHALPLDFFNNVLIIWSLAMTALWILKVYSSFSLMKTPTSLMDPTPLSRKLKSIRHSEKNGNFFLIFFLGLERKKNIDPTNTFQSIFFLSYFLFTTRLEKFLSFPPFSLFPLLSPLFAL